MGRYDAAVGVEGEYEAGSRGRVLRNLRGIRSKREMDQAEADALVAAQVNILRAIAVETRFTAALICKMHQLWLGDIYTWAGRYRTVEIAKKGFVWPPAQLVAQNMQSFESKVLAALTPCRVEEIQLLAAVLARVQAEFLLVHPFREGNGRIARWLCDLLAGQAGHPPLDYGFETGKNSRNSRAYLQAVINGYAENYEPLERFLVAAIRRGDLRFFEEENLRPRAPSK